MKQTATYEPRTTRTRPQLPPAAADLARRNQPGAPSAPRPKPSPRDDRTRPTTPLRAAGDAGVSILAPIPMATLDCSPIGEAMAEAIVIRPSALVLAATGLFAVIPKIPARWKIKALRFASRAAAPVVGTGIGCAIGGAITRGVRNRKASTSGTGAAPAAPKDKDEPAAKTAV